MKRQYQISRRRATQRFEQWAKEADAIGRIELRVFGTADFNKQKTGQKSETHRARNGRAQTHVKQATLWGRRGSAGRPATRSPVPPAGVTLYAEQKLGGRAEALPHIRAVQRNRGHGTRTPGHAARIHWQGTLKAPEAPRGEYRIVIRIATADQDSLKADIYNIDQPGPPLEANSVTQSGATLKIVVASLSGSYERKDRRGSQ